MSHNGAMSAVHVTLEIPEELGRRTRLHSEMDGFLKANGVLPDLTLEDVRRSPLPSTAPQPNSPP